MYACPNCGNPNTQVERRLDGLYYCPDCNLTWKIGASQTKPTLFDQITASPEVLAHYLVRLTCFHHLDGSADLLFASSIVEGRWEDRAEALSATVSKLKEIAK
jgi:hypothetical protein